MCCIYIAIRLESLAARSTKVKGEGKKTWYCMLRGRERRAAEPLGNRMAFPQSVEVFLVHCLLKICLIGLFKVQSSLEDGNTRFVWLCFHQI